jgi:hypothetical protein
MKHNLNKILLAIAVVTALNVVFSSCKKDFLNVAPTGQLTEELLTTKKGIEGTLIGSYAMLSGKGYWFGGSSNWVHGSILGGEANKGSNNGDQAVVQPLQRFETLPTNGAVSDKWACTFEGINRANSALRFLAQTTDPSVTADDKARIEGEARFLRGHYYFELKRLFDNVPYVDEAKTALEAAKISNTTNIWPSIEGDFKAAMDKLPETQSAAGRANKWAAAAYLAKTYLYQHKYAEAKALFTDVITKGKTAKGVAYALLPKYPDVFNAALDNSSESVFATQGAANTGSTLNGDYEFVLNFPYNTGPSGPGGCCGFYQPSFEMANSFRTDANGLPLLDGSYNDAAHALKDDYNILSKDPFTPDAGPVDPRLDHSVGRRGIPYLDWQDHPGSDWIRDQSFAGPYSPKKFIYYKTQEGALTDGSGWTRGYMAINYNIIRFADVLLMAAECEIEAGSLETARTYVNLVRARAANPAGFVSKGGSPAANYVIGLYNTAWTDKTAATTAVRFERKLELGGEGHRFFDLVRWGVADTEINKYLTYEGGRLAVQLGGAHFTAGKFERYPIPQTEIDREGSDVLKQNAGY